MANENNEKAPEGSVELPVDALEDVSGGYKIVYDDKGNRVVTPEEIKRVLPLIFKVKPPQP